MNSRLGILKMVLWSLVGVLAVVTVARLVNGLGAVTNLTDATPWGLWIGFDVMGGVALAAGGFVLAATVYIFGLERYRPFVRPAILTAFLGYIAVAVGLLYDIGLPWNIWHPAVYWQYHSVLFEVAACVMLYLTVLALEFAPVVLEHPLLDRPLLRKVYALLRRVTIPLVIAGIVLSTLHQSSLGSLFLITPYRLHPLWYSPIIYVLFFLSAIGLGFMMVVLESLVSGYFLGHRVRADLLARLATASVVVLTCWAVLRLGDLALRGVLTESFNGSWQSVLFSFEMAIIVVLPAALLMFRRVRTSAAGLAVCSSLTVTGVVLNRLDVSVIAFARPEGMGYFPSWMEFSVSVGIVSVAALAFIFFVERLRVYEEDEHEHALNGAPLLFEASTVRGLLPYRLASFRSFSLASVVGAVAAMLLLPDEAVNGAVPLRTPTAAPRTVHGLVTERTDDAVRVLYLASGTVGGGDGERIPFLLLDGDRDLDAVLFDHEVHKERLGGEESCFGCHHLDMPLDENSSCFECHRDVYEPTSVFDHASHVAHLEGNVGCAKCHQDPDAVKNYETAAACTECHDAPAEESRWVAAPEDRWRDAAGYMEAMHGLCIDCHEDAVAREPEAHDEDLARCWTCHETDRGRDVRLLIPNNDPAGGPVRSGG